MELSGDRRRAGRNLSRLEPPRPFCVDKMRPHTLTDGTQLMGMVNEQAIAD
jgi:hypothetical protein